METLKELKNKYVELQKETDSLYKKIRVLEREEASSKFTVGACYLDTKWDNLLKIVSIKDGYIHCICLGNNSISRDSFGIFEIKFWEKITSKQFKDGYLAILKDISDPDFKDGQKTNWNITYNSIVNNINKEE